MIAAIPTIATKRLLLRPWREDDFAPLADFYATDTGATFVGGPMSRDDTWRALAARIGHWQLRGYGLFSLEVRATNAWVGWCGLWMPHGWPEAEMGYALVSSARGNGFINEAAKACRRHAFEDLNFATIVSYIRPDNTPSQRVAEKLGAKRDGTHTIRETPVDVWRYPRPAET